MESNNFNFHKLQQKFLITLKQFSTALRTTMARMSKKKEAEKRNFPKQQKNAQEIVR